ncbi:MAG: VWA domain-containing protein [Candidatus Hodarchaeales archaeon]|jgi:uncharacterized protein with von Willebrand factor type A (vWA) domain
MEFIQTFINMLIDSGLELTVADRLDAENAITRYSELLDEKERFKTGLQSLLTRRPEDLEIFDYCFDVFFSGKKKANKPELAGIMGTDRSLDSSNNSINPDLILGSPDDANTMYDQFNLEGLFSNGLGQMGGTIAGGGGSGSFWTKRFIEQDKLHAFLSWLAKENHHAAELMLNDDYQAAAREIYTKLVKTSTSTKQASRKLKATERNFQAAAEKFKRIIEYSKVEKRVEARILERVLKKKISTTIEQVKKLMLEESDFPPAEVLEEVSPQNTGEIQENILDLPFSKLITDLKLVKKEILAFGKKLGTLESRRRRMASKGRLNIRKTIRCNLKNGGILADLKVSRRRIRDPSIVLLNDVSGSTGWISEFFFVISYSLQQVFRKINVYEFDSTVADVTPAMKSRSLEIALKERSNCWKNPVGVRQGNSDYETALEDFIKVAWNKLNKKTTVVLLADCRDWNGRWRSTSSIPSGEPLSKLKLKKIRNKVKRVMILNPEPTIAWNTGDSCIGHYQRIGAETYHVDTIKDLANLVYRL